MTKLKLVLLTTVILLSTPYLVFSQYNYEQKRDSLFQFVDQIFNGQDPLIIYASNQYLPNDSVRFYKEFLDEYQASQIDETGIENLRYILAIGILDQKYNKVKQCIAQYKKAQLLNLNINNKRLDVFLQLKMADAYRINGNYYISNKLYYQYIEDTNACETDFPKWRVLGSIAEIHEIVGEDVEAMEACIKLQDIYLEKNMLAEASYNLIQLGRIASHLESDTFYFEYYHRAVSMAYKSEYKPRIANNLVNLGIAYLHEGYPEKALLSFDEAKEYNEYSNPYPQAYYYVHLARTNYQMGNINDALKNGYISYRIAKSIDASVMEYASCIEISNYYKYLKQEDSAMLYLQKAMRYQSETYFAKNSNSYQNMSNLKVRMNDYKAALLYLDTSFRVYKKEVERVNTQKLANLREKSDYYIHRARISDLVIDNQKEHEKSKRRLIIMLAISLILAIMIYFIILIRKRHKQLKASYINLVEKNVALDKLNKRINDCELKTVSNIDTDNLKDEERILKKLKQLLIKEELYTNPNLSLPSLAKLLKTNTSYLSAVINSHYLCNFRRLINGYRITKAKEMLVSKEYRNYSIEGIANEVGYNSRSSFYHAFKTETGLTPALFLENYKLIDKDCNSTTENE